MPVDFGKRCDVVEKAARKLAKLFDQQLNSSDVYAVVNQSKVSMSTYLSVRDDNSGETLFVIRFSDHNTPSSADRVDLSCNIGTDSKDDILKFMNELLSTVEIEA